MIDVEWYNQDSESSYSVDIEVFSNDRSGLLVDILKELGTTKAKLMGVNTKTTKEKKIKNCLKNISEALLFSSLHELCARKADENTFPSISSICLPGDGEPSFSVTGTCSDS